MCATATLCEAYVLHQRPFRDTSALIDLFTLEQGLVAVVARGARAARSRAKPVLQPFTPLLVSCAGKTELLTLRSAESNGIAHHLQGHRLFSGIYLNELLLRLLQRFDACPILYHAYATALCQLQVASNIEVSLRQFEMRLLNTLGYAPFLDKDVDTNMPVLPQCYYRYQPNRGVSECDEGCREKANVFLGRSLLALQAGVFEDADSEILRDAKRFMRIALSPLLGERPLKSRELFRIS